MYLHLNSAKCAGLLATYPPENISAEKLKFVEIAPVIFIWNLLKNAQETKTAPTVENSTLRGLRNAMHTKKKRLFWNWQQKKEFRTRQQNIKKNPRKRRQNLI